MMRKSIVLSVLCMLCVTSIALAGVQTVKNITCSLPGTFYYVNSQFKLEAEGSADIQTFDAAAGYYNYAIEELTVLITPCDLKGDRSSGDRAIGDFYGGGVLTMAGKLMYADRGNPYGDVLYNGTILVANMVKSSSETWSLTESRTLPDTINGAIGLAPASGGFLNSGISFGTTSMVIGNMNLALSFFTSGISSFATGDYQSSSAPGVQIAASLPEPATLIMMALGGLLITKRK